MADQLTNEEIARVFAMYWGCEVQHRLGETGRIRSVVQNMAQGYEYTIVNKVIHPHTLLLTPLSKISDEDAIEVAKMYGYDFSKKSPTASEILKWTKDSLSHFGYPSAGFGIRYIDIFQYLIQKGYAVPLFFGIDHPLNGKTAIEIGIAIDKTMAA
jgi:hypothetical protein